MFKLIKIIGAKSNAPEIVEIEAELMNECLPGGLYIVTGGLISNHTGITSGLVFCPIEHVIGDGNKVKVKGFFVNSDMVFECTLFGNIGAVSVGSKLAAWTDDMENVLGVSNVQGEFAYVLDISSYQTNNKIAIKLAM